MKDRKNIYLSIVALVVAVIGLSVAYAALSTTLNISFGNVNQSAMTWNVGFQTGTVTGTASGTSATGRSCGSATVTADTVTVADTTLSKPGDTCTYALTIKNTGSIAANLATITPKAPTSVTCGTATGGKMVCGNITYKLTTDAAGNTILTTNKTLAASTGTLPVYLVVSYTGADVNATEVTQSSAAFTLIYNQA